MPWRKILNWVSDQRPRSLAGVMPLTLATLEPARPPEADELSFLAETELAVLTGWAERGEVILALATTEADELTLLCADSVDDVQRRLETLPSVVAGMTHYRLREVMLLRQSGRPTAH